VRVEKIKITCLHLQLYRPFLSDAKSAVVPPRSKFRVACFFEHFEAVPFLLLANCWLPLHLHFFQYLSYCACRGLQVEVEGIAVGRNRDIYDVLCLRLQMSHFSEDLTPS
jgi:hypothetical protein